MPASHPTFPRALARLALLLGVVCAGVGEVRALTVLMADDIAPHREFVQQLREGREPGSRFELQRTPDGAGSAAVPGANANGAAIAPASPSAEDEERAHASIRTRSLRSNASADANLTIAVGAQAARAAIERPGNDPLVLAMLTRVDYEALRNLPAWRRPERRLGVLLRDPAVADQLALVALVLPKQRRLGLLAMVDAEPLRRELARAAPDWQLLVEYAPDASSLAVALRSLLRHSDALLVLPDLIGDSQATTLALLRAGAGAGLPVFGASEGLVRSGGLAAAISTPAQLAQQARLLGQKVARGATGVTVEAALPATVRINDTVARQLGLRLPDERELAERLSATR